MTAIQTTPAIVSRRASEPETRGAHLNPELGHRDHQRGNGRHPRTRDLLKNAATVFSTAPSRTLQNSPVSVRVRSVDLYSSQASSSRSRSSAIGQCCCQATFAWVYISGRFRP